MFGLPPCLYGYPQGTSTQDVGERAGGLEAKAEGMGRLRFSGYVQAQWMWTRETAAGGRNGFSIRRGRLKAAYADKCGEAVFQIDATEEGVKVKDAYLKLQAPDVEWIALRGGIFNRPFGYEIAYSSARRESPERSRIFRTLFPQERDLGAELVVKGRKDTPLEGLAINAGLFSGNGGQAKETDSRKDFIGRLSYAGKAGRLNYEAGASLYAGGVRLAGSGRQRAYRFVDGAFVEDGSLRRGGYARRRYYGFDGGAGLRSALGTTFFRGEYLWGTQPGAAEGSHSPTGAVTADVYVRKFAGYYLQLVHGMGASRHSVVAKYDAYDPNVKVSGSGCRTEGDMAYRTFGLGWLYQANQNLRVMCYYEAAAGEKSGRQAGTKDEAFTLRLQYTF